MVAHRTTGAKTDYALPVALKGARPEEEISASSIDNPSNVWTLYARAAGSILHDTGRPSPKGADYEIVASQIYLWLNAALPGSPRQTDSRPPTLEVRIGSYIKYWLEQTAIVSSASEIKRHWAAQKVAQYGKPAVQVLLDHLELSPYQCLVLLPEISNEDPVSPECRGNIGAMVKTWKDWAQKNGYN